MPIYTRHYLSNASSMASPGLDNLKWNAPVRAGDILTVKVTIKEKNTAPSLTGE